MKRKSKHSKRCDRIAYLLCIALLALCIWASCAAMALVLGGGR